MMLVYAKPEQKKASKDTVQKKESEKVASSPNLTGIPYTMKTRFENLSGFSFDDVRVHYNSGKPAQLQALAYTQGNQIYISSGQEKHLGHVVQQKQGRVQLTTQLQGVSVNDDTVLECEADSFDDIVQGAFKDDMSSEKRENEEPMQMKAIGNVVQFWECNICHDTGCSACTYDPSKDDDDSTEDDVYEFSISGLSPLEIQYPKMYGWKNSKQITMTGDRQQDFNSFFPYPVKGYARHHHADFKDNKCTMSLVPNKQHRAQHFGACASYKRVHGKGYGS